jgi:ubiquinone/menaquinone biosynthesis C-methylase UbiE
MEHQMDVFFEIHSGNLREGPGDNESTQRAFSFLKDITDKPLIADIGCGPGMQTIELAKISNGKIIAIDNHQPFLDFLDKKVELEDFPGEIETCPGTMEELPFEKNSLDIIWSEGAIYIMGFEAGLKCWSEYLKSKGYIAVTEISWLKNNPPKELNDFWMSVYPEMASISDKIKVIEKLGLLSTANFVIPAKSWWDNYYNPISQKLPSLKEKYKNDSEAQRIIEEEITEQELFRKYSDYYGYVFYIMQKV